MPSFEYTASKEGKVLKGYIEASSQEEARASLRTIGLLPHVLRRRGQLPSAIPTFRFRARGGSGEEVLGTVEALTERSAQKRLEEDYDLHVEDLSLLRSPKTPPQSSASVLPCALPPTPPCLRPSPSREILRFTASWLLFFFGMLAALGAYHDKRVFFLPAFLARVSRSPGLLPLLLALTLFLALLDMHQREGGGKLRGVVFILFGATLTILTALSL